MSETDTALHVRRAGSGDLEALAVLFDGYRQFYGQPPDLERARRFVGERLQRGDSVIFLATIDDAPAGFAQLYPTFSSVHTDRAWTLNDLFVAIALRARGAGRALLEACQAFGEADGSLRLQLETQATNTVAQALYTELGWERDDDNVWFHLPLRAP